MSENQEKQLPLIMINNQYVKDFSLELPHAPEIFKELNANPNINININVKADKLEENDFNVSLEFSLEGKVNEKHLFILELVYACVCTVNVPEEHKEPVVMIEIPRLIFPFARSIITNSISDAGLPTFIINPIDFAAMYQAKKSVKN